MAPKKFNINSFCASSTHHFTTAHSVIQSNVLNYENWHQLHHSDNTNDSPGLLFPLQSCSIRRAYPSRLKYSSVNTPHTKWPRHVTLGTKPQTCNYVVSVLYCCVTPAAAATTMIDTTSRSGANSTCHVNKGRPTKTQDQQSAKCDATTKPPNDRQ